MTKELNALKALIDIAIVRGLFQNSESVVEMHRIFDYFKNIEEEKMQMNLKVKDGFIEK